MIRIRYSISDERAANIERVMQKCGAETQSEFFNNALTILKWVIEKTEAGQVIAAVDELNSRYTELSMPFIDNVASSAALKRPRIKPPVNLGKLIKE